MDRISEWGGAVNGHLDRAHVRTAVVAGGDTPWQSYLAEVLEERGWLVKRLDLAQPPVVLREVQERHGGIDAVVLSQWTGSPGLETPPSPVVSGAQFGRTVSPLLDWAETSREVIGEGGTGRVVMAVTAASVLSSPARPHESVAGAALVGYIRLCRGIAPGSDVAVNGLVMDPHDIDLGAELGSESLRTAAAVAAYLADHHCTLRGELISVARGRVARLFTMSTLGDYLISPSVEEMERRLERIIDPQHAVDLRSAESQSALIDV